MRQLHREMQEQSQQQNYEQAARLRDEITALNSLDDRGELDEHVQPEVFHVDPADGLQRLSKLLGLSRTIRVIEGIDIAHIMGTEAVGSVVCFIDGRPFKQGYRRFRIRDVTGIDDYAMIQEIVRRRYRHRDDQKKLPPDLILIDGGLGQLHAAQEAAEKLTVPPPMIVSLAKKEERLFVQARTDPLELPRNDPALRLLQYVRDEAHRFAQHYFHILRKRQTFNNDGPTRKPH